LVQKCAAQSARIAQVGIPHGMLRRPKGGKTIPQLPGIGELRIADGGLRIAETNRIAQQSAINNLQSLSPTLHQFL
jgi:hypothetical protein